LLDSQLVVFESFLFCLKNLPLLDFVACCSIQRQLTLNTKLVVFLGNKLRNEIERLLEFSKAFDYEHDNDREIVIVGCAYIEDLIKDILESSFIDDEKEIKSLISESTGSLSGLVPRARLLYLLYVIPKLIYEDIKIVGKIRNHFAHNVSASFNDNSVVQLCHNLKWHKESLFMEPPASATSRDIYQVGVNQLVTHLNALPSLQRFKNKKQ